MARRSSGTPSILLFGLIVSVAIVLAFLHRSEFVSSRYSEHEQTRHSRRPDQFFGFDQHPPDRESRERHAPASCNAFATTCESRYFRPWTPPGNRACSPMMRNGYPVPDPNCTPGGVNLSVTAEVLANPAWRTECLRNCQTTEAEKHVAYGWYGIRKPRRNTGDEQVCELDHLVPLELGGADGLGNIWPECGPDSVSLHNRYFKIKDRVENYLADEVKAGRMPLASAQRGIAEDWTQYLPAANRYCEQSGRC